MIISGIDEAAADDLPTQTIIIIGHFYAKYGHRTGFIIPVMSGGWWTIGRLHLNWVRISPELKNNTTSCGKITFG